jgi:acetyltransferase AlgX (SGNH hydrolase-like protein)
MANLALAAGSLLFFALLVEAAARVWVEVGVARARRSAPARPLSRYHAVLGWDKTPLAAQRVRRAEFDVLLSFNSKGLRGPERDYSARPGTRRLLVLGDSFAEGYYVDEPQTLRAVLESQLEREGCRPVEVINGGTIAYSTDQEYLFYATEGRLYGAQAVLLMFYYNDLYYNTSPVGPGGEPKPYFEQEGARLVVRNSPVPAPTAGLLNRQDPGVTRPRPWRGSMALRLLSRRTVDASPRLHAVLAALGLVEPMPPDPPREMWPFGPYHLREVEEMWTRTEAILGALRDETKARGAQVAVLYVPARFEVNDEVWDLTRRRYRFGRRWERDKVYARLSAVCAALGVPLIDPRAALRQADTRTPAAYFTRDVHWTAAGNSVAADAANDWARGALACGGR